MLAVRRFLVSFSTVTVLSLLAIVRITPLAAQDFTPPTVSFSPNGGVYTSTTVTVTIGWCDDQALNRLSRGITLNGSSVTNSFNYVSGSDPGCSGAYATSTGTISLNMGNNTLAASICDLSSNCGSNSTVFTRGTYSVQVTPDNQAVSVLASTSTSYDFTVNNTGTLDATFNLTATCSGSVSSCSAPSSVFLAAGNQTPITATFSTAASGTIGTVTLTATVSGRTEKDSGWVNTTAAQYLTVSTAFNLFEQQGPALCAANCFAAAATVSTVPYFSLDQARSITLAYNGDQVAARPFVFADVSLQSGSSGFQEYWLEAKDSAGVAFTFVNGDTKLRFVPTSTSQIVRLTGQFDAAARGYGTGVFPITIVVTAKYSSGVEILSFPTKFIVLNERASPIARGWTVAGAQRVYAQGDGAVVTTGDGSAVFFSRCGTNCYTAPVGEFSTLTSSGSGTGLTYTRSYPDSSYAIFNYVGRLTNLISRSQDTVAFDYDVSWRLTKIYDPFRANGGVHLYTALSYGANGLSSIQEPGLFNSQSGGRVTSVTVASDSTLTTFTDPDNVSTQFVYDASRRLSETINRHGDTATVYYQSVTWKVDSVASPRFTIDPRLYGAGQTGRLVTANRPWQTAGMPLTTTVSTAATPVKADTIRGAITAPGGHVTAYTVNRWGQPLVTTALPGTSLARVTTVYRTDVRPDSIRHHEGGVDRFAYTGAYLTARTLAGHSQELMRVGSYGQIDSLWGATGSFIVAQRFFLGLRGQVDSARTASQYTTKYTYDARHRVLTAKDPLNRTTSFHYETFFGNKDSTLAPGNRFTRARFDGCGRDTASNANTVPWSRTLYDVMDRVSKTFHDGQGDTTTFTYDSLYLKQVRDAKGQLYGFAYNPLGAVSQRSDPAGASENYYYNLEGLQTTWINRRSDTVATTYDALLRPLTLSGRSVVTRSFAYDSTGRTRAAWNAYVRDSLFASPTGWADSTVTRFAADPTKRFRTFYKPNPVQLVDSVNIVGTGTSVVFAARRYIWNSTSLTLDTVRLNGTPVSRSYNGTLVLSGVAAAGITNTLNTTTTNELYESVYSDPTVHQQLWRAWRYDSLNRVGESYSNASGTDKNRSVFRYDSLARLVQVADSFKTNPCISNDPDYGGQWCSSTQSTFQANAGYGYDAVGNMTSVSDLSGSGSATHATGNRLTSWPGYTFGSDAAGNRIWQVKTASPNDTTRYFWSAEGMLDSVQVRSAGSLLRTFQYDYNATGQLVRRRINASSSHYFLWDRGQLVAELDSTFGRLAEYAYYPGADRPVAVMHGATSVSSTDYYQIDAQGNVLATVSDGGSVSHYMQWEPWGFSVTGEKPTEAFRLGWKGLFYDDSTSLYYMRARWYDPRTKRFMTEDPSGLAGGINPYAFAANDPVNGSDPSGLRLVVIGGVAFECVDFPNATICLPVSVSGITVEAQPDGSTQTRPDGGNPFGSLGGYPFGGAFGDAFGGPGGVPPLPPVAGSVFSKIVSGCGFALLCLGKDISDVLVPPDPFNPPPLDPVPEQSPWTGQVPKINEYGIYEEEVGPGSVLRIFLEDVIPDFVPIILFPGWQQQLLSPNGVPVPIA